MRTSIRTFHLNETVESRALQAARILQVILQGSAVNIFEYHNWSAMPKEAPKDKKSREHRAEDSGPVPGTILSFPVLLWRCSCCRSKQSEQTATSSATPTLEDACTRHHTYSDMSGQSYPESSELRVQAIISLSQLLSHSTELSSLAWSRRYVQTETLTLPPTDRIRRTKEDDAISCDLYIDSETFRDKQQGSFRCLRKKLRSMSRH